MDDISQIYDKVVREIEQHIHALMNPPPQSSNPHLTTLAGLMEAMYLARSNPRDVTTAQGLLQKAVEGLLEHLSGLSADTELMLRFRDCHLLVLKGLQDHRAYGAQWTNKQVTRSVYWS